MMSKNKILFILASLISMSGCLPDLKEMDMSSSSFSGSDANVRAPASGTDSTTPSPSTPTSSNPMVVSKLDFSVVNSYMDREAIISVITDAFTNSTFVVNFGSYLKDIRDGGSTFGLACNPYGSGCKGSFDADVSVDSSTVRQLLKSKACEDLVSYVTGTKAVLSNAGQMSGANMVEVSNASVTAVSKLFFRARDLSQTEINSYLTMNQTLMSRSTTLANRWSLIILNLCESPEWEILN